MTNPMDALKIEVVSAKRDQILAETAKLNGELARIKQDTVALKIQTDIYAQNLITAKIATSVNVRTEEANLTNDVFHHFYNFNTQVDSKTVEACMDRLSYWHRTSSGCDIEIVFTSPGGDMLSGFILFDYIQSLRRQDHKITTGTLGMAASMAGTLLQAGDVRYMGKEAWLMLHEGQMGVQGKVSDVEDSLAWTARLRGRVVDIIASRCGQASKVTAKQPLTKTKITTNIKRKDWWISSDEALTMGLVDEVR